MKTTALTMIVGPGDGPVLQRCLQSFSARDTFNQIILVLTTNDEEVEHVARTWTTEVYKRNWTSERYPYGDFAGARNEALSHVNTDYWMWLDADDIAGPQTVQKLSLVRGLLDRQQIDVGFVPYEIDYCPDGSPTKTITRERIIRTESGIRWVKPVHEQLTVDPGLHVCAPITGAIAVCHKPVKSDQTSMSRNLQIIRHEYERSPRSRDRHCMFHYARELLGTGQPREAVPILLGVMQDFAINPDTRYVYETADMLARHYLYTSSQSTQTTIRKETLAIGEMYARIAATTSPTHAEPLVAIGDAYLAQKNEAAAVDHYKAAMGKVYGSGGFQDADYYEFIPASRLATIYKNNDELEMALYFGRMMMKHDPKNVQAIADRKDIVCQLLRSVL